MTKLERIQKQKEKLAAMKAYEKALWDEGKAYIYEGNRIYEVDIDTNDKEMLKEIEPYEELEFNWTDEGLTIDNADDGYHELVEIK